MSAEKLGKALVQRNLTLSTAESCTGGLLGHLITNVPGASRYYLGGVISYSNEIKTSILGVSESTIERFGAVSRECAVEMASGVRQIFGADIGVATTGIAGPGGGTPEKPVGLVYIAIASTHDTETHKFLFKGTRVEIKTQIASKAIALLLEFLQSRF